MKRGDTLTKIAEDFGMGLTELRNVNGLSSSRIYPGQKLVVHSEGFAVDGDSSSQVAESSGVQEYVVRRGDTLFEIAASNKMSINELQRANGLSGSRIYPGQRLLVGGTAATTGSGNATRPATYVVRRGDNLHVIARRFGVSVADLTSWNDMRQDATLYPGTKLTLSPKGERIGEAVGG